MKSNRSTLCLASGWLATFVAWTLLVCTVDVQIIGPHESAVGLATLNAFVHDMTGVHMTLYILTDWLGLVPFAVCVGFAGLGLAQWIKRKHLALVDRDLFMLGGFYIVVMAVYVLFETIVINYRPILIDGCLEVSYPSSTTMLTLCVMPTTMMQLKRRLTNIAVRRVVLTAIALFTAFMVIGRVIAGVHWISDIIGGVLISAALITLYGAMTTNHSSQLEL